MENLVNRLSKQFTFLVCIALHRSRINFTWIICIDCYRIIYRPTDCIWGSDLQNVSRDLPFIDCNNIQIYTRVLKSAVHNIPSINTHNIQNIYSNELLYSAEFIVDCQKDILQTACNRTSNSDEFKMLSISIKIRHFADYSSNRKLQ